MTASLIDVDRQAGVTVVTLRRPPVNAMNIDLTEEIASAFQTWARIDRSNPLS
jgi:enoyl-CoA hydratase/carnithine racemase